MVPNVAGLIKTWPWTSSSKQITFLNELEELLELAGPDHVQPVMPLLFSTLAKCAGSSHFQVAERTLFLWNNEQLLNYGVLAKAYTADVLPTLYGALHKSSQGHWNPQVETLANNVLKHYHDADPVLFQRCAEGAAKAEEDRAAAVAARDAKWRVIEEMAAIAVTTGGRPA